MQLARVEQQGAVDGGRNNRCRRLLVGHVEAVANAATVVGWAWDPACRGDWCEVDVGLFDDRRLSNKIASDYADLERRDVAKRLGFGLHSGFKLRLPRSLVDGKRHELWVAAKDHNTNTYRHLHHKPLAVQPRAPIGRLEPSDLNRGWLQGWALDPDAPRAHVAIEIGLGEADSDGDCEVDDWLPRRIASVPRSDVNRNTGYPGDHGFVFRSGGVSLRLGAVRGCVRFLARDVGTRATKLLREVHSTNCGGGSYRHCGGRCVDIEYDARHCGGCNRRCGDGQRCWDGYCED